MSKLKDYTRPGYRSSNRIKQIMGALGKGRSVGDPIDVLRLERGFWQYAPSEPAMPWGKVVSWFFSPIGPPDIASDPGSGMWDYNSVGGDSGWKVRDSVNGGLELWTGDSYINSSIAQTQTAFLGWPYGCTVWMKYEVEPQTVADTEIYVGMCNREEGQGIFDGRDNAIGFFIQNGRIFCCVDYTPEGNYEEEHFIAGHSAVSYTNNDNFIIEAGQATTLAFRCDAKDQAIHWYRDEKEILVTIKRTTWAGIEAGDPVAWFPYDFTYWDPEGWPTKTARPLCASFGVRNRTTTAVNMYMDWIRWLGEDPKDDP